MQAAVVKGYRLAFNLRAFPPLEPGMGSLEPAQAATETTTATNTITNSKSLYMYKDGTECHGALIKLTADNYEKVMRSEGIDHTSNNTQQRPQAYEEIVVDCYPYNHEPNSPPIQAIALRARDHARLPYDPSPSKRYMKILQEGANELGLKQCYQAFLANHPVQELRPWQRKQALYNLIFTFGIMMKSKYLRSCSSLQNRLLYLVYVPSSASWFSKIVSDALTAIILFPGALIGLCLYIALRLVTGSTPAPIQRMMDLLSENEGESKDKKQE